jgi:hypothetical protein
MPDCVRGRRRASLAHTNAQAWHRQFHCGKPPPAAEYTDRQAPHQLSVRAWSTCQNSAGR